MKIVIALMVLVILYLGFMLRPSSHPETPSESASTPKPENEAKVVLSQAQIDRAGIKIERVSSALLTPSLKKLAKITFHPDRIVHVLASERGKAQEAYKNVGDLLKKGEALARLSSQAIGEKKTTFLIALNKQTKAEEAFKRSQELFDKHIISLDDYKTAETERHETQAQLEMTKQELAAMGLPMYEILALQKAPVETLQQLYIRSPIEGIVLERHFTLGENIDTTEPIYVIANLSKLWVEIPFFPSELAVVARNQEVLLEGQNEGQKTHLMSLIPQVGQESYLAKGIAEVDNANGTLLPGSLVNVEIKLSTHQAPVAIKKEAIQILEGKPHVFIASEQGFIPREVTLGQEDDQFVEVLAGLEVGEPYTTKRAFLLKADLGKGDVADDD